MKKQLQSDHPFRKKKLRAVLGRFWFLCCTLYLLLTGFSVQAESPHSKFFEYFSAGKTLNDLSIADIVVTGEVTDVNGEALPGVTIIVKGTTVGTTSNVEGNYNITVPNENVVLSFSFVGYATKEVVVGNQTVINVSLVPEITSLQEVVVVGYGTLEKRELTSAVTTIDSEQFQQGAFNSPLQMIQGKVPGVSISNTASADPNRSDNVQIRGTGSLSAGNGPLIVIDGMPGGDLRNLMQQDIKSIDETGNILICENAVGGDKISNFRIYATLTADNFVWTQKGKHGYDGGDCGMETVGSHSYQNNLALLTDDEFVDELSREFLGGRHRRTDLIRWDRFGDVWWDKSKDTQDRTVFPIPSRAINASPVLTQNK